VLVKQFIRDEAIRGGSDASRCACGVTNHTAQPDLDRSKESAAPLPREDQHGELVEDATLAISEGHGLASRALMARRAVRRIVELALRGAGLGFDGGYVQHHDCPFVINSR
jgi:hypothetical protein